MKGMFPIPLWVLWFVLGVILIIIEIFTPAFFAMIIGIACIITGVSAIIFPNYIIIHLIVFGVSLTLMMIFLRPVFVKYLSRKNGTKSNVDAIIGKEAIVDKEINNDLRIGYIKIGADYYKAKSINGDVIPVGSIVKIEKMDSITATVSLIIKEK